jgi:hypothetical protein
MMTLLPTKYANRGKCTDKDKGSGTGEGKGGIPDVLDGPSWQMGQRLPSFLILTSRHDLQN